MGKHELQPLSSALTAVICAIVVGGGNRASSINYRVTGAPARGKPSPLVPSHQPSEQLRELKIAINTGESMAPLAPLLSTVTYLSYNVTDVPPLLKKRF